MGRSQDTGGPPTVRGQEQVVVIDMQEAIGQRLARALAKVPGAPWEKVR